MTTKLHEVYDAINGERRYQDTLNKCPLDSGSEILLLAEYVDRARKAWTADFNENHDSEYLHMIRKIAGIAVRTMEHYGAPKRK